MLRDPVTITLDGEPIVAERGEPVAAALLGADRLVIARSPKFHRPRGPSCMRAACDGCLARVDDAPNVMTCLVPAEEGTTVVTQNRLGPREADLLRMTDWFFPDGMNHHELFAGVPGVQNVMQAFARRVAGLGRLPAAVEAPRAAARRAVDVVIVGAGAAGMALATRLAAGGRSVEVVDDQLVAGGSMRALGAREAEAFSEIRACFTQAAETGKIRLRTSTVAGGMYGEDLLVVGPGGAEVLEARALVFATGAHDGALAFEGNDVPGVMSARAAGVLLAHDALPAKRVVVIVAEHGGPFGESFAHAAREVDRVEARDRGGRPARSVTLVQGEPVSVRGATRVRAVTVRAAGVVTEYPADLVVVDAPRAPAYELPEQAGADVVHERRGFVVRPGAAGRIREGVFAVGEVAGTAFDAQALASEADVVAAAILSLPAR
ncbi:MAG: Sarcosine oxidase alpha subunit [Labilithrix sp.]|nr:Sarcosine oxidase alpha subunit [Labilithrix sp.]